MARSHAFAPDVHAHVYNRGVKKSEIRREEGDFWRLLSNLFYFNHAHPLPMHWKREIEPFGGAARFSWPEAWGTREPLVDVLAFNLMPNHLHLILKERIEGGVSAFMHRVLMGYSKYINEKYHESGSLFQGPFRSRLVEDDFDLRNLAAYVMVKNAFELYPGGLKRAIEHFDDAFEWAAKSPFCSLAEYVGKRSSPILTKGVLDELFATPEEFKEYARECMLYRYEQMEDVEAVFGV